MTIEKTRKALIGVAVALTFLFDGLMGVPGLGIIVFSFTLLVLFARILIRHFRPHHAPPTVAAWLALAMFLEALAVGVLANAQTHANKRVVSPVVQALDAYCQANGTVPATLDPLVPDYIDALPTIRQGIVKASILFMPDGKKPCAFVLLVPGFPRYGYRFDSTTHEWSYPFD